MGYISNKKSPFWEIDSALIGFKGFLNLVGWHTACINYISLINLV